MKRKGASNNEDDSFICSDTSEEFSALPQNDLSKPENTCAMFLLALALYLKDCDAGVATLNTLRGPRPLSNYDI